MRRLFALTPREGVTLLRCMAAAVVVEILWRADFRILRRTAGGRSGDVGHRAICDEVTRLMTPAWSLLRRDPGCLKKACAIALALRSYGIRSRVVLGVNRECGFRAHAWVTAAGEEYLREAGRPYDPVAVL